MQLHAKIARNYKKELFEKDNQIKLLDLGSIPYETCTNIFLTP